MEAYETSKLYTCDRQANPRVSRQKNNQNNRVADCFVSGVCAGVAVVVSAGLDVEVDCMKPILMIAFDVIAIGTVALILYCAMVVANGG